MERRVNIVISVTKPNQLDILSTLTNAIGLIEVRADLISNPERVKKHTSTPLVYVLRSNSEGGNYTDTPIERVQRLIHASTVFDFVELEGERDLIPEILNAIPEEKRRISWHGPSESSESLKGRAERYMQVPASCYKLIVTAHNSEDAIPVVRLLDTIKNKSLVAYTIGSDTAWTQISAPFMGAPEIHAKLDDEDENSPSFSASDLMEDYGLPFVYSVSQFFGIIGNPVFGSVSPNRHNAAYRSLKLPYLYLPFQTEHFSSFFEKVINNQELPIPISGLTVVSPFKTEAYETATIDLKNTNSIVKACNGLLRKNNGWSRYSSDATGSIEALNGILSNWSDKKIAIVGCGGAGSSIAERMKSLNVTPTLVNRTISKGLKLSIDLDLPFVSLSDFSPGKYDVIIHCTPIGKTDKEVPFDVTKMKKKCVVIDHVYSQQSNTPLVEYCLLYGMQVINGVEMANIQIKQQFLSMLKIPIPTDKIVEQLKTG
jgi:3-dehydroquinate dehydratase/shikimate dehydrogenase